VHRILRICLAIAAVLSAGFSIAGERASVEHIRFDTPTLAPMAYTQFCLRYPAECRQRTMFRGGPVRLSATERVELARVNDTVNARITPEANQQGLAGENLADRPRRRRLQRLRRHQAPRVDDARLAVAGAAGERGRNRGGRASSCAGGSNGDLVLDNLTNRIKPWFKAPFRWVRMQMPGASKLWTTIISRAA
jgi:predicted transglutaminase-like cysteine proteinase